LPEPFSEPKHPEIGNIGNTGIKPGPDLVPEMHKKIALEIITENKWHWKWK
jgi:hypothetical protein